MPFLRALLLSAVSVHAFALSSWAGVSPGHLEMNSPSFTIKASRLYWGPHLPLRSRQYVLESATFEVLPEERAEIYQISPHFLYEGQQITVALIGNFFTSFPSPPSVSVGEFFLNKVEVVSPTLLTFEFPQGISPGIYEVALVFPDGYVARAPRKLEVRKAPPVIRSVFPNVFREGTTPLLEVKGEHFMPGVTVVLGGHATTPVNVKTSSLEFYAPEALKAGYQSLELWFSHGKSAVFHNAVFVIPQEEFSSSEVSSCAYASTGDVKGFCFPFALVVALVFYLSVRILQKGGEKC